MCKEFHCECCPDDLPQIICICVDCYHGDEEQESKTQTGENPDKPSDVAKDNYNGQAEGSDQELLPSEEKIQNGVPSCCGNTDINLEKTEKLPCCGTKDSDKPCMPIEEERFTDKTTSTRQTCCESKRANATRPEKSCEQEHESRSKEKVNLPSNVCQKSPPLNAASCRGSVQESSSEVTTNMEQKQKCCSAKKDDSCQKSTPQNVAQCCSTRQESPTERPCNSDNKEQKKSCCSKKTGDILEGQDIGESNSLEKVPQQSNSCPSKTSSCSDAKMGVVSCCDSSSKDPERIEIKTTAQKPKENGSCCSSKTSPCSNMNTKSGKEQNGVIKSPCCPTDSTSSSTNVKCGAAQQDDEDTCCSAKTSCNTIVADGSSSCNGKAKSCKMDETTCPSLSHSDNEATCVTSQKDKCCGKDEEHDSLRNDECCTKEETVLLIDPCENPTTQPNSKMSKSPLVRRNTTKLRVQNICCAMEAQLVEECLKPLKGIESVAVNVIGRVVHVRHDPEVTSPTELVNCLNKVHLGATVMEIGAHQDKEDGRMPRLLKLSIVYVLIQAILLVTAVTGLFLTQSWYQWIAIAEIIFGGAPILKYSIISVKNRRIDINILMLIAIIGTIAISEWVEGATVVFVFAVADVLQEFCMFRVQRTISGLMLKRPEIAVLVETGESVPIESVAVGTLIAVRPGELIPLDGVVVKGRAAVDESSITGEALPVEKTVMSKVFSGTVNQNGYIEVETTSDSSSSTVSKVAQMVQEAQSSSTKTEAIINRFAKYYTPLVVLISALIVVIPAILGASGVGTYMQDIREWGRRALVMLVIACPCALVMATPIAVVCSITAAARKGALVKGGEYLETLSKLKILAFDKTGTLTEGMFQVTNMESVNGEDERDFLRLAAGLESKTVHPISAAIVNEFSGCVAEMVKSQIVTLPEVTQFTMYEGQGISGLIEGKRVRVGNREMVENCGASLSESMTSKYQLWSCESKTVVFLCVDEKVSLMIALADSIRPNTSLTLEWLRNLGVQTSMITGDNSRTAEAVKSKLAVDECVSEMKPHDKLEWIKEKQTRQTLDPTDQSRTCCRKSRDKHVVVGMVGDGVNDGPALASANVGIAMGAGGTALAVEAADVALMSNNLAKIPELITLAKFCNRVVKQNICISVVLKVVIVIVALSGYVTLWMAVVADVLGLLVVILNGLRPLSWKAPKSQRSTPLDIELGFKKTGYKTIV